MAACGVHPALQQRLVVATAAAEPLRDTLAAALDCVGGVPAALRRLLVASPAPAAVLAAAANASGHPCALGVLLAQLLARSLCHGSELLGAVPPAELAAAVGELHATASSTTLSGPAADAAQRAFTTLVTALVTSASGSGGGGQEQRAAAERALAQLRQAWAPAEFPSSSTGAALLAGAVAVVDQEVFPRQQARRQVTGLAGGCGSLPAAMPRLPCGCADQ